MIVRWLLVSVAGMIMTLPAHAQPSQPSIQQQFDSATEAFDSSRWAEAARAFGALEQRLSRGNDRRSLAVVRVRRAAALLRINSLQEAADVVRLGLADLPEAEAALAEDRFLGLTTLGELAELDLDFAQARRHFAAARAIEIDPVVKIGLYRGLVQTLMFSDAPSALAAVDEGLALARRINAEAPIMARLHSLRGRVLMNMRRLDESQAELRSAMDGLGGLGTRVDLADIIARSDLALAAMLDGNARLAQRYLAYTGAGRFETRLASPARAGLRPPNCNHGVTPDDVAIIEYSILDDGRVGRATPIYASGGEAQALRFAGAVMEWGWDPSTFEGIPALFRAAMRVELRCSQAPLRNLELPAWLEHDEVKVWAASHGLSFQPERPNRRRPSLATLREELRRTEAAGGDSPDSLPLLVELALHPTASEADSIDFWRRALVKAEAVNGPARLVAGIAATLVRSEYASTDRSLIFNAPDFDEVLSRPAVRDDPRTLAALRIQQAQSLFVARQDTEARSLVTQLLGSGTLAADDSLRGDALAIESAVAAAAGEADAAARAFRAIGPDARVCFFAPRIRRNTIAGEYPNPALEWGFEGWATIELSPTSDGRVAHARTIMSYPPFVFDEAAEDMMDDARLDRTHVPPGATCEPVRQTVNFTLDR